MWKQSQVLLNWISKSQTNKQSRLVGIVQNRCFLTTPIPEVTQMDPNIKSYKDLYNFSIEKPEIFWKAVSGRYIHFFYIHKFIIISTIITGRLDWHQNFTQTIQGDFKSGVKWFVGGKLNVSGK